MYIEKNIYGNSLGMLLNLERKTKDNIGICFDLQEMTDERMT